MSDLTSLMEADTQSKSESPLGTFDDSNLKGVAKLAQQITDQETLVKNLEEKVKEAKKELYRMSDEELPNMLAEMGVSSFKLQDGSQVEIKKTYGAVNFGMGEDQQASDFKSKVEEQGLSPKQQESIPYNTLRAWVKEQTEEGRPFPMELFGAYIGQRAVVKGAK